CRAADDPPKSASGKEKTPLQTIMIKMEDQTKAVRSLTSSAARFKKAGQGKGILPAAEALVKLAGRTRKFTEPAEVQKKTRKKWDEFTDQHLLASGRLVEVARKNDFAGIRQALKGVDNSCTNCHGLFRPKTGGDDFGP
ncbi:MAG: cytochrome c, partial [Planctomycetia bacterium]|nr:cytochrome c [Planctomycetia bacterium]